MTIHTGLPDDAPGVVLLAIGPLIGGQRKPPIFRIRTDGRKFYIDNKRGTGKFGRWHALGEAADMRQAVDAMNQLNSTELRKHRLSQWPTPAAMMAELAAAGIGVQ